MSGTSGRGTRRGGDVAMLCIGLMLAVIAIGWLTMLIAQARADRQQAMAAADAPALSGAAGIGPPTTVLDEAFGVSVSAPALRRVVQVLQWREVASQPLAPEDDVLVDQGDYQLVWTERHIDSDTFAQPYGHENPPAPPYRSAQFGLVPPMPVDSAGPVPLWQPLPADGIALPENLAPVFRAAGPWLLTAASSAVPEAGDLRVRFDVLHSPIRQAGPEADAATPSATTQTLTWIARASAFLLALIGAGLALRAGSRLSTPASALGRLPSGAVLALAAWAAVACVLIAAGLSRGWPAT